MAWARITGKPYQISKFLKQSSGGGRTAALESAEVIILLYGDDHQKWLNEFTQSLGLSWASCDQPAKIDHAPCGKLFTTDKALNHHRVSCKVCNPDRTPRAKTVAVLPGLKSADVMSLAELIESRSRELLSLASEMEKLATAIKGLEAIEHRAKEIEKERSEFQKALDNFLHG